MLRQPAGEEEGRQGRGLAEDWPVRGLAGARSGQGAQRGEALGELEAGAGLLVGRQGAEGERPETQWAL